MPTTPVENAFCNMLTVFSNPADHPYEVGLSRLAAMQNAYLCFVLQLILHPFENTGEGVDDLPPELESILVNKVSNARLASFKRIDYDLGETSDFCAYMLCTFEGTVRLTERTLLEVDQFVVTNNPKGDLTDVLQELLVSQLPLQNKLYILEMLCTGIRLPADHLLSVHISNLKAELHPETVLTFSDVAGGVEAAASASDFESAPNI